MGSRSRKIVALCLESIEDNVVYNCEIVDDTVLMPAEDKLEHIREEPGTHLDGIYHETPTVRNSEALLLSQAHSPTLNRKFGNVVIARNYEPNIISNDITSEVVNKPNSTEIEKPVMDNFLADTMIINNILNKSLFSEVPATMDTSKNVDPDNNNCPAGDNDEMDLVGKTDDSDWQPAIHKRLELGGIARKYELHGTSAEVTSDIVTDPNSTEIGRTVLDTSLNANIILINILNESLFSEVPAIEATSKNVDFQKSYPKTRPTNNNDETDSEEKTDKPDWQPATHQGLEMGLIENDGNQQLNNNEVDIISSSSEQDKAKERVRRKIAQPEEWKKNKSKKARMLGEDYIGYSKKEGTVKQNAPRAARKFKEGCINGTFCKKSSKRNCGSFAHDKRKEIFDLFWKMSWPQKKVYVISLVIYEQKKRCYVQGPSRRHGSFFYCLRLNNTNLQVCKKMFLTTLGLNEKMVHNWVLKGSNHGITNSAEVNNAERKSKRSGSTFFKVAAEQRDFLQQFLELLPKAESHYCRKDSQKQYFQHPFQTKSEIFDLYRNKCEVENKTAVSITTFNKIFDSLNLALFKPRKDQCDTCLQYKAKQLSEDDYQSHLKKKTQAQEEKKKDTEEAVNGKHFIFTMDVQSVKLCPVLEASKVYFKSRLQVHNFTIYNLVTHQCTNYVWNEVEGDLQASVFTSCIVKHLEKYCLQEKKSVIIFSDGCGYQNRNTTLSNALSFFSTKYGVQIEQKYLEKGHTQMQCDSTHALVERKLKGREITLPSQYAQIIRAARKKPFPLDVEYLSHDYFLKYDDKSITRYESIRPGKIKSDPTVSDLRCLKYSPDGTIHYKLNYDDEYKILPQRTRLPPLPKNQAFKQLFNGRLPIKESKYKHLQELKSVLDLDVHSFYDNLPYK